MSYDKVMAELDEELKSRGLVFTDKGEPILDEADEAAQLAAEAARIMEEIKEEIQASPGMTHIVERLNSAITKVNEHNEAIVALAANMNGYQNQVNQMMASLERMSMMITMNCKAIEVLKGADGNLIQWNH